MGEGGIKNGQKIPTSFMDGAVLELQLVIRGQLGDKFNWPYVMEYIDIKVSFFGLCSKMQIIPIKNLNIKTWFIQFLWFSD